MKDKKNSSDKDLPLSYREKYLVTLTDNDEISKTNEYSDNVLNETLSGNVADEFGPSDFPRLRYIKHNPMDSFIPFQSELKNSMEIDSFFTGKKNYFNLETTRVTRDKDYYLKDIDEDLGLPISIKKLNITQGTQGMKNATPTSGLKTDLNDFSRIKNTILLRNNFLSNLYQFTSCFVTDINIIFTKINEGVFRKITATLDTYKNFLKFFKDVIECYQKTSSELSKTSQNLSASLSLGPDSYFDKLGLIFEKTQSSISENLNTYISTMSTNLLVNGPFYKIKELYAKMGNISKDIMTNLSEINFKKEKIIAKHGANIKIFEAFKNNYNDYDRLLSVMKKNEFFLIEYSMLKSFNKLIEKVGNFYTSYKQHLRLLINLLSEFTNFLKETMQIYFYESNKVFTHYLDFQKIEKIFEELSKDKVEEMFHPSALFGDSTTALNECLNNFQLNILKFNLIKNDELYVDDKFKLNTYQSISSLVDFITQVIPVQIQNDTASSQLLSYQWEVKRDPGFFKSWRTCFIVVTIQGNVIIFDEKIQSKFIDKMEFKSCSFTGKEDKKNPFRFEISEIKKGFIYNSNAIYYFDSPNQASFESIAKVFDPKILMQGFSSK